MAGTSPYLETPAVLRLTQVRPSTLDSWVKAGLVTPSVRAGSGRRRTRQWTVTDVVVIKAVKTLRDAGCPSRLLKKAKDYLTTDWTASLAGRTLFWDGRDLLDVRPWEAVGSVAMQPGQLVFHVLALPLDAWASEAKGHTTQALAAKEAGIVSEESCA